MSKWLQERTSYVVGGADSSNLCHVVLDDAKLRRTARSHVRVVALASARVAAQQDLWLELLTKPDKPDQPLATDFRQRISTGYRHKKHAAIVNDRTGADRAGLVSDRAGAGGAGLVSGSVDVPGDRETGLARSASSRCCPPSPTHPAGMVNKLLVQTKSSVNACSEIQEAIEWRCREVWKESHRKGELVLGLRSKVGREDDAGGGDGGKQPLDQLNLALRHALEAKACQSGTDEQVHHWLPVASRSRDVSWPAKSGSTLHRYLHGVEQLAQRGHGAEGLGLVADQPQVVHIHRLGRWCLLWSRQGLGWERWVGESARGRKRGSGL